MCFLGEQGVVATPSAQTSHTMCGLVVLEPFLGGSHALLVQALQESFPGSTRVLGLKDAKWHWKLRTAAAVFAERIPEDLESHEVLFASSMLNLAELVALRPDLLSKRKVFYFHENQLAYPVQKAADTDFQLSWIQIVSAAVADVVLFNSEFNMRSFLEGIPRIVRSIASTECRPKHLLDRISNKCFVAYFPICLPPVSLLPPKSLDSSGPLTILWSHRMEHDKNPLEFFRVVQRLASKELSFRLVILGQAYDQVPDEVSHLIELVKSRIIHLGFCESKAEYWKCLRLCDVVVSTAHHEFFGVSVMEAVHGGCFPILPNRVVYPELYPKQCLYNTQSQLFKILKSLCYEKELDKLRRRSSPWNLEFDGTRFFKEFFSKFSETVLTASS
jgi:glycosyltransferase involved in cell wall biosynthesis